MKKLLPLFLMAVIASCSTPKYYSCPKYVGVVFSADTLPKKHSYIDSLVLAGRIITKEDDISLCVHKDVSCKCARWVNGQVIVGQIKMDTTCEWMHISMRDMAFVINRKALAVRRDGYCIAHLDGDKKPFPVHWHVGWCQGKDSLFNRLVKEGRAK